MGGDLLLDANIAFEGFIESEDYDRLEGMLMHIAKTAYATGFDAASPQFESAAKRNIFQLLKQVPGSITDETEILVHIHMLLMAQRKKVDAE